MSKTPEMEKALDQLSAGMFGMPRSMAIKGNVCVTCKGAAHTFRDHVSRNEYGISGLCQDCQDEIFGGAND